MWEGASELLCCAGEQKGHGGQVGGDWPHGFGLLAPLSASRTLSAWRLCSSCGLKTQACGDFVDELDFAVGWKHGDLWTHKMLSPACIIFPQSIWKPRWLVSYSDQKQKAAHLGKKAQFFSHIMLHAALTDGLRSPQPGSCPRAVPLVSHLSFLPASGSLVQLGLLFSAVAMRGGKFPKLVPGKGRQEPSNCAWSGGMDAVMP